MAIFGSTHHMLVSAWGTRWRKVELVTFTLHIDDSGTSPSQHVAIATALVIPATQIIRLEREWNALKEKHGFCEFHTSAFVARNAKSEFANWTEKQQTRLFSRVRQISRKYGVRAISIAVNKKDYDEVVPDNFKNRLGKHHYTWAIRQLVSYVTQWQWFPAPREWLFQWMGGPGDERRIEVETVMEQAQWICEQKNVSADFASYSFRKSAGIPGLQCVDAIGWVCYRHALFLFHKTPIHPFAKESWHELEGDRGNDGWLIAITILRHKLEKSIKKALADGKMMQLLKGWEEHKEAKSETKKRIQEL